MKTYLGNIDLGRIFTSTVLLGALRVLIILVVGFFFVRLIAFLVRRLFTHNISDQSRMILNKAIMYSGGVLVIIAVLSDLGVKLSALLGAAGVVGIAVGIASQTSLGNIISGLFLVSEKTFEIGDVVTVGSKTGIVYSIDLLSIKLRTFDNLLIRIPNQTIISSELTNITRFPIRRMDFTVGVAYKEDLQRVRDTLLAIARQNPLCLDEPEPLLVFNGFGNSSIDILLGIWFEKSNYLAVKNSVIISIKERFDELGIEIPFPHVSLYTGSATEPFPVRMVDAEGGVPPDSGQEADATVAMPNASGIGSGSTSGAERGRAGGLQ